VPDLDERLLHGFLGIAAVAKNTQRHAVEFPAGLAVQARESRPVPQAAARQQLPDVVLGHARPSRAVHPQ
jgi:hypothetical protein